MSLSHRLVACDGALIRTAAGRKCVCLAWIHLPSGARRNQSSVCLCKCLKPLVIFVIRSRDQMNSYTLKFRFLFFFFSSGCCVHRYHHTDLLESLFSSLFDFLFAFFSSWHLFLYIVGYRSVPSYLLIYDAHWFTLDHVVSPSCPWKAPTASSVGCNQHEQKRNALFPTPSLLYRSDERWSADVFFIICQDTLYSFSSRFLMLVYSSYSYFAISFF